jgi:hypothetical protein
MTLDLQLIRSLLHKTLGYESFAAGFISRVTADPGVRNASINAKGDLRYNPGFVRDKVKTEADLFCLVFHELLHPAFGHFIHKRDDLANIACDAIINSVISNLFPKPSANGCLFVALYPERGLAAILRPGSQLTYSRYQTLYQYLYPAYWQPQLRLSAGELIQTLKALCPPAAETVLLLGSHSTNDRDSEAAEPWSDRTVGRISNELLEALREAQNTAGHFSTLIDLVIEVLKTKRTLRQDLLLQYATRKRLDGFFDTRQQPRRITSPFPINPSRRDLVLLSAGIWPGFFRNRQPELIRRQKGIAVFLDVSGSVNESLPQIIGLLARCRSRLASIHLFSNEVVEVPFAKLCAGELQTTHGTDFDCVAEAIIKKGYDRAVVVTDGCADLKEENAKKLRDARARILTVLFDGPEECEALALFGEVVQLDALVDEP